MDRIFTLSNVRNRRTLDVVTFVAQNFWNPFLIWTFLALCKRRRSLLISQGFWRASCWQTGSSKTRYTNYTWVSFFFLKEICVLYVFFWVFPRRLIVVCPWCEVSGRDVYALQYPPHRGEVFLVSNFLRVLNLVCIVLGISLASDCGLPTFWNPLSVSSSRAGCKVHPALEDGTDRGFRNVGKPQSDAGEIPKRIHTRTGIMLCVALTFRVPPTFAIPISDQSAAYQSCCR